MEAGIGHNRPPLAETLAVDHAALAADIEALAKEANAGPKEIKTEADLESASKIILKVRPLAAKVEKTRVEEKEPHLSAGREVDAFFRVHADRLSRIADFFQKEADKYTRAKADEERRKAAAAAQKLRDEQTAREAAAAKAQESNRLKTAENHEAKAGEAAYAAEAAEARAAAPAAELTRTRFAGGGLATAKTEWNFAIENLQAIPLETIRPFLKPEVIEQAVRAFVKINKNAIPIPGVRIFEDVKASIR